MQHEIKERGRLLDRKGHVRESGFARHLLLDYDRKDIKVNKALIKEWDYYLVSNGSKAVAFTISDLGYIGMVSCSYLDIENKWEKTNTILTLFPLGKYNLSPTSVTGDASFTKKDIKLEYKISDEERVISLTYPKFIEDRDLSCDIHLKQRDMESMVIATPFKENPKKFYYNQKISTMPATGRVTLGDEEWILDENKDFGVLDWGRGVWTYSNVWYWGIASGKIDDVPFGFNLGYGFSDRSSASENVIFYGDKVHKLEDVTFDIPKKGKGKYDYDYLKEWKITSSDKRFEAIFTPELDRNASINVLVIATRQHQVFGKINGRCVLDDGKVVEMKDFPCAIEVVRNRY